MWDEIVKYLPEFPSGVLTGFNTAGQPLSLRVQPRLDLPNLVVRFQVPSGLDLQAGKACLLCHRHDERLWNLMSFVVQGDLVQENGGWLLRPERFIPGMGIGGLSSYIRFVTNGRKNTDRYLQKRGLKRPRIPWEEIAEMMAPAD
jgi:hypothetical protein